MMVHNGLVKLSEENAEVIQVAQKLVAYPELQTSTDDKACHPDGTNLRERLEDELGDAWAAHQLVLMKLGLNSKRIAARAIYKLELFQRWDKEP